MSLPTKAIFAALVLSLTPISATAQNFGYTGPSNPQINGIAISNGSLGGIPLPGGVVGTPVQARDCGAARYQGLVGQHVSVAQSSGVSARYFTPHSPYGTMDFLPHRLNVSTDDNFIIDRVYCG